MKFKNVKSLFYTLLLTLFISPTFTKADVTDSRIPDVPIEEHSNADDTDNPIQPYCDLEHPL